IAIMAMTTSNSMRVKAARLITAAAENGALRTARPTTAAKVGRAVLSAPRMVDVFGSAHGSTTAAKVGRAVLSAPRMVDVSGSAQGSGRLVAEEDFAIFRPCKDKFR